MREEELRKARFEEQSFPQGHLRRISLEGLQTNCRRFGNTKPPRPPRSPPLGRGDAIICPHRRKHGDEPQTVAQPGQHISNGQSCSVCESFERSAKIDSSGTCSFNWAATPALACSRCFRAGSCPDR